MLFRSNSDEMLFEYTNVNDVFDEEYDYIPIMEPPAANTTSLSDQQMETTKQHSTRPSRQIDARTAALDYRPGGALHWEVNTGLATKMPAAFKHHLKDKAINRILASSVPKDTAIHNVFPMLYDSGCGQTQITPYLRSLLDNVHPIAPVSFDTAGHSTITCRESGTLRFKVQGVQEVISMPCLLNPGTQLMLLSLDQFEGLDTGNIKIKALAECCLV